MRHTLTFIGLLLLVVTVLPAPVPALAQGGYEPEFEWDDCPFPLPEGETEGNTIDCGYLFVPQDRTEPDGPWVELAVAILYSTSGTPADDPLLYLEGGPGGSALDGVDLWVDSAFRDERDIILLDQRGTGYSYPRLVCYEVDELDDYYDTDDEVAAHRECVQRLRTEDEVDVADYTSRQSAADIADLRVALDYDEWNLYGVSYGTRLALTVMRDQPAGVRSVILDSVYPPVVDAYEEEPVNAYRSFRVLFDQCAADAACNGAFPNLEQRFYALVDRLDSDPLYVASEDLDLDGATLVDTMFEFFYDTTSIPYLPLLIDELDRDSTDTLLMLFEGGPDYYDPVWLFVDELYYAMDDLNDDDYYGFWDALDVEGVNALPGLIREYFSADDADYLLALLDNVTDWEQLEYELYYEESDPVWLFADELFFLMDDMDDDSYYDFWDELDAGGIDVLPDLIDEYFSMDDADYLLMLLDDVTDWDQLEYELYYEDVSDSDGLFNAVECQEELPFNSYDEAVTLAAGLPTQVTETMLASVEAQLEICVIWQASSPAPVEDLAVSSAIPTLVLSGQYDPITPPAWGTTAAATLPNSFSFEFPGVGHGAVDGGDCPVNIALAFLNAPTTTPDATCITAMSGSDFVLP